MACRLRRKESAADGFRRITRKETAAVVSLLADRGNHIASRVHDARRHFKRLRALLHLVKKGLDPGVFAAENQALRVAARRLSSTRDADASLAALDRIGRRLAPAMREELRRHLEERARSAARATTAARLGKIAIAARNCGLRIAEASLQKSGWALLSPGFARSLQHARKLARGLGAAPADPELHRCRRTLKRLNYQLELIRHLLPRHQQRVAKQLIRLADLLGDDHDLSVLAAALQTPGSKVIHRDAIESTNCLIAKRREVLQRRARKLARECFRAPAKAMLRRLHRAWKRDRKRA